MACLSEARYGKGKSHIRPEKEARGEFFTRSERRQLELHGERIAHKDSFLGWFMKRE